MVNKKVRTPRTTPPNRKILSFVHHFPLSVLSGQTWTARTFLVTKYQCFGAEAGKERTTRTLREPPEKETADRAKRHKAASSSLRRGQILGVSRRNKHTSLGGKTPNTSFPVRERPHTPPLQSDQAEANSKTSQEADLEKKKNRTQQASYKATQRGGRSGPPLPEPDPERGLYKKRGAEAASWCAYFTTGFLTCKTWFATTVTAAMKFSLLVSGVPTLGFCKTIDPRTSRLVNACSILAGITCCDLWLARKRSLFRYTRSSLLPLPGKYANVNVTFQANEWLAVLLPSLPFTRLLFSKISVLIPDDTPWVCLASSRDEI